MTSIVYIGMDVHSTNYTLCAFMTEGKKAFGRTTISPNIRELVKYLETLNRQLGGEVQFECGYEAGGLGYTLYEEYLDMSDEEYRAALEAKRGEITSFILEQCRTKKSNLYRSPSAGQARNALSRYHMGVSAYP